MKYSRPREFVRNLDAIYLKYVSFPLLGFFAYYIYFLVNVGRSQLYEPEIQSTYISLYISLWVLPLIILFRIQKKIVAEVRQSENLEKQIDTFELLIGKKYLVLLLFFVLAIVVFMITNNQWMSLPVWFMFILVSLEKPSMFKAVKIFKFKSKEEYDTFLKDEWL